MAQAGVGPTSTCAGGATICPRGATSSPGSGSSTSRPVRPSWPRSTCPSVVDEFTDGVPATCAAGRHRRHPRQLLAVGPGRPPAQARARAAAGVHLPHAGPGEGRDRRPRARAPGRGRDRGHRLLRRHPRRPAPAEATQLGRALRRPPERIEIVPPGVDHAFFSPGDRRRARARPRPRRPPRAAVRRPDPAAQGPRRRGRRRSPQLRRTATPCWWSSADPAARTARPRPAACVTLVEELGLADRVRFVAAAAPPPALHLLPGGRRRASCPAVPSPSGSSPWRPRPVARPWWPPLSAGCARWSTTAAPASSSRVAIPRRSPRASTSCSTTRRWPAEMGAAAARAGPGLHLVAPPPPACAASTPTSPRANRRLR